MPQSEMLKAIIVVVTYNSEADVKKCVESVAMHFPKLNDGQAELHVVDNNSSDETPDVLKDLQQKYAWLQVHYLDENIGFGPANNLVMTNQAADAYILLNADAWLVRDSFTPALTALSQTPSAGIIGLPLVYPDGSPQTYAFLASTWQRWLTMVLGLRRVANALVDVAAMRALMRLLPLSRNFVKNHGRPALDLDDSVALATAATGETRSEAWVAGAAMVISPRFIEASGGFDPKIFLYGEDEDLCIQSHKLGFDVKTLQTTPIVHKLGWGGDTGFRPVVAKLKYDSLKYFIKKNVDGALNRTLMRILLPAYVYGRNLRHFLERKSE